jgi:hypothetical protein
MSGRREQDELRDFFEGIKDIQRDYDQKAQDGAEQRDRATLVLAAILALFGDSKKDDENV